MKHSILFPVIIIAFSSLLTLVSCDSPNRISKKTAMKLLSEEVLKENISEDYATITTGFYEQEDKDERFELRKLAAAGVIDYSVQRIAVKVTYVSGYYYDYYFNRVNEYSTRTIYKYFVKVGLTEKGESYLAKNIEPYEPKKDKYESHFDDSFYPEDAVSEEEVFPEDIAPEAKEKEADDSLVSENNFSNSDTDNIQKPMTEYEKLQAQESVEIDTVRTYSVRIADVRDIFVKDKIAYCKYVLERYGTTPFGRVVTEARDGYVPENHICFVYYQDKGWQYEDKDMVNYLTGKDTDSK